MIPRRKQPRVQRGLRQAPGWGRARLRQHCARRRLPAREATPAAQTQTGPRRRNRQPSRKRHARTGQYCRCSVAQSSASSMKWGLYEAVTVQSNRSHARHAQVHPDKEGQQAARAGYAGEGAEARSPSRGQERLWQMRHGQVEPKRN